MRIAPVHVPAPSPLAVSSLVPGSADRARTSTSLVPPLEAGPKLPPAGPDRELALSLLERLAQSGPTGRHEIEILNAARTTIRFRDGSGAEYDGTVERGDNTITIGRDARRDIDYAAEIMAHEIGHQQWSFLHLDDRIRAAGVNPDHGAGRLINEAFASSYGNQVRKDQGRSPDTGHGSNLREDYLRHLDPTSRLGAFYTKYYGIDLNDPETKRIRDVTSKDALRALLPLLQHAGVRDAYLRPGLD